jgi:hypothetical protein
MSYNKDIIEEYMLKTQKCLSIEVLKIYDSFYPNSIQLITIYAKVVLNELDINSFKEVKFNLYYINKNNLDNFILDKRREKIERIKSLIG